MPNRCESLTSLLATWDRRLIDFTSKCFGFLVELFKVNFEGNLMSGALNQLVGSHQWIPAT